MTPTQFDLFNQTATDDPRQPIKLPDVDFTYCTDIESLTAALAPFAAAPVIAIDTETTGLNPRCDRVRLVQLAAHGHPVLIADVFAIGVEAVAEALRPILTSTAKKTAHNWPFDFNMIRSNFGYEVAQPLFDTLRAANVLECGREQKFSLAAIARRHLGYTLDKTEQVSDWSASELTRDQLRYAALDPLVTLELRDELLSQLVEADLIQPALIEMQCLETMADLEFYGVPFDSQALVALQQSELERSQALHQQFVDMLIAACHHQNVPLPITLFGECELNVSSQAQLLPVLNQLGYDLDSLDQNYLKTSRYCDDPLILSYLEWKKADTATSDAAKFAEHIDPSTGRVYPSYRNVDSARLVTHSPNVQQMPRGSHFRSVVRPTGGFKFAIADWSQIELRIAAQISQDERMIEAYRNDEDLHRLTAALTNGIELDAVQKHQRQAAKAVNFGLIYSLSVDGLRGYAKASYGVTLTAKEAADQHAGYFKAYRGIKRWHDCIKRKSKGQFYIRNMTGRRRYVAKDKQRLGVYLNTPVQSVGADMLKYALHLLRPRIQPFNSRVVLIVHDEIVVEAPEQHADEVAAILGETMVEAGHRWLTDLPCVAEAKVADSWAEK